jgi:hypothetical protein
MEPELAELRHTLARISVGGRDVGAILVQVQIAMPW